MAIRLKQKPILSRGGTRDVSVDLRNLVKDTGALSDVTIHHDYDDITVTDAQVSDAALDILGVVVPTGEAIAFRVNLSAATGNSYILLVRVTCADGEVEPFEVELLCK